MEVRGGDGGIRTLDRALQPYNGLANRRLQPLGHVSGEADMPHTALSCKRQMLPGAILPVHINCGHGWEAESALPFRSRRTPIGALAGTRIGPESRDLAQFRKPNRNRSGQRRPCRGGRPSIHIYYTYIEWLSFRPPPVESSENSPPGQSFRSPTTIMSSGRLRSCHQRRPNVRLWKPSSRDGPRSSRQRIGVPVVRFDNAQAVAKGISAVCACSGRNRRNEKGRRKIYNYNNDLPRWPDHGCV